MDLFNLKKRHSHKSKKTRVGRGYGSSHGGHTSLRGNKGQKSRTGGKVPWYFEGGQLPLIKRLPHIGGFKSQTKKAFGIKTDIVEKHSKGIKGVITPQSLVKLGVIPNKKAKYGVKIILGTPTKEKLNLKGFSYTKGAKQAIEKAGGTAN